MSDLNNNTKTIVAVFDKREHQFGTDSERFPKTSHSTRAWNSHPAGKWNGVARRVLPRKTLFDNIFNECCPEEEREYYEKVNFTTPLHL